MTGSTHIAIGIASSLVILQPKTVPECLCAITGGMIGGMISDIDSTGKRESMDLRDDPYGWQIYTFIVIGLAFILSIDYVAGNGAVDYVLNNFRPPLWVGGIAFLGICAYGITRPHRTFTHSFIAGASYTVSLWCFCKPVAIPFAIGFASHLFIDFFNRTKVQYFWPLPIKIGLNLFPADGRLNDFLGGAGTIVSIFLASYYMIGSFSRSVLYEKMLVFFSQPTTIYNFTVPLIFPYLIAINCIGFFSYLIIRILHGNGLSYYGGTDEHANEMEEFIMTLLLIIDVMGGMIGKLLAVLAFTNRKIYKAKPLANFNLYIIPICFLVSWLVLLFTFYFPTTVDWIKPIANISIGNIPMRYIVLGYLLAINLLTLLLVPSMHTFAYVITPREKLCMLLSLFGGATGGYLSMKTTGKHKNAIMLASTLPEMMVMHAIVLSCAFFMV